MRYFVRGPSGHGRVAQIQALEGNYSAAAVGVFPAVIGGVAWRFTAVEKEKIVMTTGEVFHEREPGYIGVSARRTPTAPQPRARRHGCGGGHAVSSM